MSISVTDLFSIGIGPSSSHTVGPLRAAEAFLSENNCPDDSEIAITLHGSLAATGIGHGTDRAAILGLAGYTPITLTPDVKPVFGSAIPTQGTVSGPRGEVHYRLIFDPVPLPEHPNAMTFVAYAPMAIVSAPLRSITPSVVVSSQQPIPCANKELQRQLSNQQIRT